MYIVFMLWLCIYSQEDLANQATQSSNWNETSTFYGVGCMYYTFIHQEHSYTNTQLLRVLRLLENVKTQVSTTKISV